jgi:hypothetical protein
MAWMVSVTNAVIYFVCSNSSDISSPPFVFKSTMLGGMLMYFGRSIKYVMNSPLLVFVGIALILSFTNPFAP